MNQHREGDLLFSVRVADDILSRRQMITAYIDAGTLNKDGSVRNKIGVLVDFLEDGTWHKTKNEAIDETIAKLKGFKE